ncbi:hypothetical protein PS870_06469 [Pseudomonas fluorescens]|uniref:Lipoprotein n=1 Tax=Pseudomonas fluorescens TaxID=294 RepID=A0A5E7QIM3_PSEFL|nr:hypothetical protein [Pseudomonas fluorescens]VVP61881.1 hypothetical protein PS870_06469 [Pseudomonas fluorescens]
MPACTRVMMFLLMMILSGCVGFLKDNQVVKTQHATNKYYLDDKEMLWSESTHPVNGTVALESEHKWCAVTVWVVVIPIPLMLPVCKNSKEVSFVDNRPSVETIKWLGQESVYLCGPVPWLGSALTPKGPTFCWFEP